MSTTPDPSKTSEVAAKLEDIHASLVDDEQALDVLAAIMLLRCYARNTAGSADTSETQELAELIHDALQTVGVASSELRRAMPDDTGWHDLDDAKRKLTRARAIAATLRGSSVSTGGDQ